MSLIQLKDVSRVYEVGEEKIHALNRINLSIEKGEFAVILGPSGSGKSTLLNLIGGMDKPTGGKIEVENEDISNFNERELELYRRNYIGFVFQFYNLIPSLTARENVAIAANLTKSPLNVDKLIDSVGLTKRKNLFPSSLSGGELQRLSIARALVKNPKILLCDEPTGALDSKTGTQVLDLLKSTAKENNISLVIVTHNSNLEQIADKLIKLKDGKINSMETNKSPKKISEVQW